MLRIMENIDIKISTNEMQKSAIIYRDDSARFIYVCFHCGTMFNEINATLRHIESHFQVVNVMVDQMNEDGRQVKEEDNFVTANNIDVKLELLDESDDHDAVDTLAAIGVATAVPMNGVGKRKSSIAGSKVLKKCKEAAKQRTKKIADSSEDPSNVGRSKADDERTYRCHKCSTICRNVTHLRSHLKKHIELKKIFKCTECDEYFKNASTLRVHVLGVHLMKKTFKCSVCSVKFSVSQSDQFLDHLRSHNKSSNSTKGIQHHNTDFAKYEEIDSFKEEPFPCDLCPQRFYVKANLDTHMKGIHSRQRRMQCPECNEFFSAPKLYYAHQLEHKRVGPYITEQDENLLLANLTAMVDERVVCQGDDFNQQSFSCLICNATSDVHHNIRSHIRRKHVYKMFPPPLEEKQQFICDFCGVTIKSKFGMVKHLQIHTDTKSYPCSICGKTFRLGSTRTIHERQHTGEKPYQCHECGRAFISKGLLTAHKKRHEDTTYPCHICGKTFNLPAGYRNHVKTHRVDRPFKCEICSKTFNTLLYLRRHEAIHSDRKHPCQFCGSEFNTGDGVRQHYRHKHKDEWKPNK